MWWNVYECVPSCLLIVRTSIEFTFSLHFFWSMIYRPHKCLKQQLSTMRLRFVTAKYQWYPVSRIHHLFLGCAGWRFVKFTWKNNPVSDWVTPEKLPKGVTKGCYMNVDDICFLFPGFHLFYLFGGCYVITNDWDFRFTIMVLFKYQWLVLLNYPLVVHVPIHVCLWCFHFQSQNCNGSIFYTLQKEWIPLTYIKTPSGDENPLFIDDFPAINFLLQGFFQLAKFDYQRVNPCKSHNQHRRTPESLVDH